MNELIKINNNNDDKISRSFKQPAKYLRHFASFKFFVPFVYLTAVDFLKILEDSLKFKVIACRI